jgi:predicted metal-dependent phosphoesterase TrpH
MAEAFGRYIKDGAPAFVPTDKFDAFEAIGIIHESGGVAVLAHPGHWTRHSILLTLIRAGLDGIEVRHPSHNAWLVEYYQTLAADFVLVGTGGSDYHGHRPADNRHLGKFGVSAHELAALKTVHDKRRYNAA